MKKLIILLTVLFNLTAYSETTRNIPNVSNPIIYYRLKVQKNNNEILWIRYDKIINIKYETYGKEHTITITSEDYAIPIEVKGQKNCEKIMDELSDLNYYIIHPQITIN